jgi:hypothetical protein
MAISMALDEPIFAGNPGHRRPSPSGSPLLIPEVTPLGMRFEM